MHLYSVKHSIIHILVHSVLNWLYGFFKTKKIVLDENLSQIIDVLYLEFVGYLLYISNNISPYIFCNILLIYINLETPSKYHFTFTLHAIINISVSLYCRILYRRIQQYPEYSSNFFGYSDGSFGGYNDEHKYTSGYLFLLEGVTASRRRDCTSLVANLIVEA